MVDGVQATGTKIVTTNSKKPNSKKHGTRTLTAEVWAGPSGRLVQGTVSASGVGSKGSVGVRATLNLTGYGVPVTITVPAPSQVKTIPLSTIEMLLGDHRGSHVGHGLARKAGSWSGHSWTQAA
jgi:hypothetical protein